MSGPEPNWTQKLGATLEKISHDVFDGFRWMMNIGIARFIAIKTQSDFVLFVSYGLMAMLMIFLVSVFLLRGEIKIFPNTHPWKRAANMIVNMAVCMVAFTFCIWMTFELVEVLIEFQEK